MVPTQSPTPAEAVSAIEKVTSELEEATSKLEEATSKIEEATELRKALGQAGVLDTPELKIAQDHAVGIAKREQEYEVKEVQKALKNALTSGGQKTEDETRKLIEVRNSAVAVLASVQPPAYDKKKMKWVIISLLVACLIIGLVIGLSPSGGFTAIAGLVIAAIGQLCNSATKASDVKSNPRLEDGIALIGEAIKFFGALTVLIGAVVGI